ncbi:MAG: PAP/fibrillin family protein [Lyngbya sp. HA4199-MV5]|jgi:hypothetical protein|nr:PAP/fibrillin family protein [Lyngbya sp. HA4199-MV5]
MIGKAALLSAIAGTNRGLLATDRDRQAIGVAIAQLEDRNPTPRPIETPALLEGDWRLLYTTSQELLGIDRIPFAKLGQIYQSIRVADKKIYNIAEISGLPYLDGLISVAARFNPASDRRVEVKFERAIFGLTRLIGYQSPDRFIQDIEAGKKFPAIDFGIENRDRQGWLDITYLDDDMRIGRGNEGSVFVLSKK